MLSDVLTELQLERLKEHKYSVSGSSMMEPPLQVYWRWLVTKLPLWLAPNLITFIGMLLNVVTTLILMVLDPQAAGKVGFTKNSSLVTIYSRYLNLEHIHCTTILLGSQVSLLYLRCLHMPVHSLARCRPRSGLTSCLW